MNVFVYSERRVGKQHRASSFFLNCMRQFSYYINILKSRINNFLCRTKGDVKISGDFKSDGSLQECSERFPNAQRHERRSHHSRSCLVLISFQMYLLTYISTNRYGTNLSKCLPKCCNKYNTIGDLQAGTGSRAPVRR